MRIDALEDQETGFQCGDADDNDEGRYILFYFSIARKTYSLMRELILISMQKILIIKENDL